MGRGCRNVTASGPTLPRMGCREWLNTSNGSMSAVSGEYPPFGDASGRDGLVHSFGKTYRHVGILELVDIGRVPLSERLITNTVDNLPNERIARGVEDPAELRVAKVARCGAPDREVCRVPLHTATQTADFEKEFRDRFLLSRPSEAQDQTISLDPRLR